MQLPVPLLPSPEVLSEAINDGFLLVDPAWKVIYSNRKAQQLLRKSARELVDCTLWNFIDAEYNEGARQQLIQAVEGQTGVEIKLFYPQLFIWHEVRAMPSPAGLILIIRDITDREWLIHREAERVYLRGLFMDAPVAMSVMRGFNHEFEFVNREGRKLIGGRNVEGLLVREAFPEVVAQGFLEIMDHVYQSGETYVAKGRVIKYDRSGTGVLEEACFDMSYQALRGFNGKVNGILNITVEASQQ